MFSREPVNTWRQPEIDLGKFVVMILLPFIHAFILCSTEPQLETGLPYIFDTVIGGPLAAPMFIFAMGVSLVFSRHSDFKTQALRGVNLFILGFIFNILRFIIPFLTGYAITGETERFISPLLYCLFRIDILQFSGLALILMAIQRKFKTPLLLILLTGLALSLTAAFTGPFDTNNLALNIILGFFLPVEDSQGLLLNEFTLFNWFIVVCAGYLFGTILSHLKNKNLFYAILFFPCLFFSIFYFYTGITGRRGMFGDGENCYYHISTIDAFAAIITSIGLISLYHFVSKIIPSRISIFVYKSSCALTSFYVIHWILLSWTVSVFLYIITGTTNCSSTVIISISSIISVISLILALLWKHTQRKNNKVREKSVENK